MGFTKFSKTRIFFVISYLIVTIGIFVDIAKSDQSYSSSLLSAPDLSDTVDGSNQLSINSRSFSSNSDLKSEDFSSDDLKVDNTRVEDERSEVDNESMRDSTKDGTLASISDVTLDTTRKVGPESHFESSIEDKPPKVEFVITRNAELSIENLFPTLENAVEISLDDINRYSSVELKDEKVLESQLASNIQYFKVTPPLIHDSISGLGTSDPRIETGINSSFDLFVNGYQPRLERILNFVESNINADIKNRTNIAVSLFQKVTYGECLQVMKVYKDLLNDVDFCTSISRQDVLSLQLEDLPKNLLKDKDEIYQLRGIVLSIPFLLFTDMSKMKWRHVSNQLGIYQAYNAGAIDGFAHFDFLSRKLRDMINFLHTNKYQLWDDVRIEIYYGIKKLRSVLSGNQSKKVKKLLAKLALFYINWFKGSKSKKPCSKEYYESYILLQPIYEGIKEIRSLLNYIKNNFLESNIFEEEFGKYFNKKMFTNIVSERKVIINAISPMFLKVYNGLKEGKITHFRHEVLRILAILEEIDFSTDAITEAQDNFKKCLKYRNNQIFKSELSNAKRLFYKLIKEARKVDSEFPYPLTSSPLYIKGVKFGIKNLFRKSSARTKSHYYREYEPFRSSGNKN